MESRKSQVALLPLLSVRFCVCLLVCLREREREREEEEEKRRREGERGERGRDTHKDKVTE